MTNTSEPTLTEKQEAMAAAVTGANLDWLLSIASTAPLICVHLKRPRRWQLAYGCQVIREIGDKPEMVYRSYEITEDHDTGDDDRRAATVVRFRQVRLRLMQHVVDWATSGEIDGRGYAMVLPLTVPYAPIERAMKRKRLSREAEAAFRRDMELHDPIPGIEPRWAMKHKPSGVVVFFTLPKPMSEMSGDDFYAVTRAAMDDLIEAVNAKRRGHEAGNGGPRPC